MTQKATLALDFHRSLGVSITPPPTSF